MLNGYSGPDQAEGLGLSVRGARVSGSSKASGEIGVARERLVQEKIE